MFRELIGLLASRDVRVRYKQADLGLLAAILQQPARALVLTLAFHGFFGEPSGTSVPTSHPEGSSQGRPERVFQLGLPSSTDLRPARSAAL